jgi:hypothetical protein
MVRESTPPLEARKQGAEVNAAHSACTSAVYTAVRAVGAAAIDELFPAGDNVIPGLR